MTLGLSMLVKDETEDLCRLFKSIQPVNFDEICVAFTGNNPETRTILEKNGARIFEFDCVDDWAAARNFVYQKATSEYVMWLDADDTIENSSNLRVEVEQAAVEGWTEVQLEYKYRFDPNGSCTCSFFRERIVKRDLYKWIGSVNETLECIGQRKVLVSSVSYIHHHNWQIDQLRLERNLRMSTKAYAKPDRLPKEVLYYGQSLYDMGQAKEASIVLREYVNSVTGDESKIYGLFLAFFACMDAFQRDEALKLCQQAEKIWPECGEVYYRQALVYFSKCDWKKTIELCEKCLDGSMPVGVGIPLNPLNYTLKPAKLLAEALVADGRWQDALKVVEHTLKTFPQDAWLIGARKDLVFKYLQEVSRA